MVWKTLPLWAVIIGGLAVLASVLVSEVRHRTTTSVAPPSTLDGDLILTGFRLSTLTDGEGEWEVSASRARLFDQEHRALLDSVHGRLRTADGAVVEFEGPSAEFDTVSHDLEIEGAGGAALVKLPSGYVLRAERLRWIQAKGELTSDAAVSLEGPRLTLRGVGLRVMPASQEFTILNQVRADVS